MTRNAYPQKSRQFYARGLLEAEVFHALVALPLRLPPAPLSRATVAGGVDELGECLHLFGSAVGSFLPFVGGINILGGRDRSRTVSCAIHIKKIGIAYLVDVRILCSSRSNLRLEVRRLFLVKVAGESLGPEVLPAGLCSPPIGRLRRANAYAMRYYENPITFVSLPVFVGGPEPAPGRPPCRAATVPTEPCTSVAQTRRAPSPWSSPSRRTTSRTR